MPRHPMPFERQHSEPVLIRLTPADWERLHARARALDVPPAVVARSYLVRALEEMERQPTDRAAA